MKKLPTLYKKGAAGELLQWSIHVEGSTLVTTWGRVDGTMQTARDTIKEGKNLGKKNETTPEQQAQAEALSRWEKQLKAKGYAQSEVDAEAGKRDARVLGGIDVMLAHRYDEHGHKIQFPAFAQPKLDGHRCIVLVKGGKASLWSRTRKPITGVPHIARAFEDLIEGDAVFDGELYNHDYRDNFEDLTSFIRQQDPKEGHEVVQYHIYDCPWAHGGFGDRLTVLKEFFEAATGMNNPDAEAALTMVETIEVASEDELMVAFENFLKQGYEGAIARNAAGVYVNKRSYDLLKVKSMADAEYPIVGVEAGRGKLTDKAIFVCRTPDGTDFRVKMKGALKDLEKFLKNPKLALGKKLTVQYFDITGANKVPRFPVGLRIREDV